MNILMGVTGLQSIFNDSFVSQHKSPDLKGDLNDLNTYYSDDRIGGGREDGVFVFPEEEDHVDKGCQGCLGEEEEVGPFAAIVGSADYQEEQVEEGECEEEVLVGWQGQEEDDGGAEQLLEQRY